MIDIIIPAYNADKTIDMAIRSLACQTIAEDICVTIVDDCSECSYDDIIKKHETNFKSIQLIRLDKNSGTGTARKVGMEATTEPYIGFLDADDIYYDVYSIVRLFQELDKNPECIVALGDFLEQRENGEFVSHPNDMVWCFSKLYRRSWLKEKGITFNDTRCNEDAGFNTKISLVIDETKEKLMSINQPTYVWQFNEQGITKINKFAYGYTNGITGYVDNKIEAFDFSTNIMAKAKHSYAVLVQLYKIYIEAIYIKPENADHVFAESKRFTDHMFPNPINIVALTNGVMLCKPELDKIRVLPTITLVDFCKKLGMTITDN